MALLITQDDVMNRLHNLMGHRVSPGGTEEDLQRFCQDAFDYCWRYYKWRWSMKTATTLDDGILPTDFDLDGYYSVADTNNVIWDSATNQLRFDPIAAVADFEYQIAPPTLNETGVPFPSAQVVALGAFVYAKKAENPTRADVQQEWDMFHSELDRLVGRAFNNQPRRPVNFHDLAGTFPGDVGA